MYGSTFPSTDKKDEKKDIIKADDPKNKNLLRKIFNEQR